MASTNEHPKDEPVAVSPYVKFQNFYRFLKKLEKNPKIIRYLTDFVILLLFAQTIRKFSVKTYQNLQIADNDPYEVLFPWSVLVSDYTPS